MSDYKVNFREMEIRVVIDGIAYARAYAQEGCRRYIELVRWRR